jgi:hypothetical protein
MDEMLHIHKTLISIQAQLTGFERDNLQIQALIQRNEGRLMELIQDHEVRLRDLEAVANRGRGMLTAYATLAGVLSGCVVAALQTIFQ